MLLFKSHLPPSPSAHNQILPQLDQQFSLSQWLHNVKTKHAFINWAAKEKKKELGGGGGGGRKEKKGESLQHLQFPGSHPNIDSA